MSFPGTHEDAKRYGKEATVVIDGEEKTSPVRDGGTEAGGAPMSGGKEFSQDRTRMPFVRDTKALRRKYK